MKSQEIRHNRIIQLRNMALRGATLQILKAKCMRWNISKSTQTSYLEEVRESLLKVIKKNV